MKKISPVVQCLILFFLSVSFCNGQNWKALNPPLNIFNGAINATTIDASGNVYSAGDFTNNNNAHFVARWDGVSWNELGSGTSSLNAKNTILTLANSRGNIYAAGGFLNTSRNYYVSRWDGNTWSELGTGVTSLKANGLIYTITVDKAGNVYAAGGFTNSSGKNYIAKWNGSAWSELGSDVTSLNANNDIFAITADSAGNIYAAGNFINALGKKYVAKWNGSTWIEIGSGNNSLNANSDINYLASDINGNVYAAGAFRNSNNQYYVAKWNGSGWSEIGSGNNGLNANGSIQTIAVKNPSEIYAAGYFTDAIGNYYVAKWNGISWSKVNSNSAQNFLKTNEHINSIQVEANGHIFAAGKFTNISNHQFVAEWNGTGWKESGSKGDPFYPGHQSKVVADINGNVYVSGNLRDASNYSYIMLWNNSDWKPLYPQSSPGQNIYGEINGMAIDKFGNVYLGGSFKDVNGNYVIEKWDGAGWSKLERFPNELQVTSVISDVQTDKNGNVYALGSFNDSQYGLCSLAKWDGTKWSRLPGSLADWIKNFCIAPDGNIYAYGSFTNAIGSGCIVKYSPFGWKELKNPDGSGFAFPGLNIFNSIVADSKSNIYANGDYTDGNGMRYIGKWNGQNWSKIGVTNNLGINLIVDPFDNLYAGSLRDFSSSFPVKKLNGTTWVNVGTTQDAAPLGETIATDPNGNIYSDATFYNSVNTNIFIAKFGSGGSCNISAPLITSGSAPTFCQGGSVTLTSNAATGNQWYKDGVAIIGSTQTTLLVNLSGRYTATVSANGCISQNSNEIVITVYSTLQQPTTISGANVVCQNSVQTYSVAAVTGATSYTWTLPSGWSGTSTTNSITTTTGNSGGTLSVKANNNCGSSNNQTLNVTVNSQPQVGSINGNTSVCQGRSETYSVTSVPGAISYTWTLPSGWTGTSTANSITTTVGISGGTISVTASFSCGNSNNQTLNLIINPIPSISSKGDTVLLSSAAPYYQWYFNNNIIAGETSNLLRVKKVGFYRVETSPNKNCWSASLDFPILVTLDRLPDTLSVNIYPNPAVSMFNVHVKLQRATGVITYVTVTNTSGTIVLQTNKLIFFGTEVKIPISLNPGVYYVKVYINGDIKILPVVVQ